MAASAGLSRGDLDDLLNVVEEAAWGHASTPFSLEAIERLTRLIRCDRGGYYEYRRGVRPNTYSIELPFVPFPSGEHVDAVLASWPLLDIDASRTSLARAMSDHLTRTQRRRNPFHNVVYRQLEIEDELKLWLPAPTGFVRGFFFCRGKHDRDFGEREKSILHLLGPHLARMRDRWEHRNQATALLTPREIEVIRLAATGLTNREIAEQLVVSVGTVRSHLDHIYTKLGVHTRTGAVAAVGHVTWRRASATEA